MTEIFLLAPGPSAAQEIADKIKASGHTLGVITSAYDLAPWADFIVAGDAAWWLKNPSALSAPRRKFCAIDLEGTEKIEFKSATNSGVLGLECAKRLGAGIIYLFGFDMKGTHYFGPYTNGLKNTAEQRRKIHISQYMEWESSNRHIKVFNCTKGSVLTCFEFMDYAF